MISARNLDNLAKMATECNFQGSRCRGRPSITEWLEKKLGIILSKWQSNPVAGGEDHRMIEKEVGEFAKMAIKWNSEGSRR